MAWYRAARPRRASTRTAGFYFNQAPRLWRALGRAQAKIAIRASRQPSHIHLVRSGEARRDIVAILRAPRNQSNGEA